MSNQNLTKKLKEVFDILKESNRPMTITEISNKLDMSYQKVKDRLHKLYKLKKVKRPKRGVYYNSELNLPQIEKLEGKMIKLNGLLYNSKKCPRVAIYNAALARICKNSNVFIQRKNGIFVLRKVPKEFGVGVHPVKGASHIVVTSKLLTKKEKNFLANSRSKNILIGIYPGEWGVSIKDIFGTENKAEGELFESLSNFLNVKKTRRKELIKSDLIIKINGKEIPVEITTAHYRMKRGKRSDIKTFELLGRFYFALKWSLANSLPFILIIHENWKNYSWILREVEYLRKKNIHVLYTNFKKNWSKKITPQILNLCS